MLQIGDMVKAIGQASEGYAIITAVNGDMIQGIWKPTPAEAVKAFEENKERAQWLDTTLHTTVDYCFETGSVAVAPQKVCVIPSKKTESIEEIAGKATRIFLQKIGNVQGKKDFPAVTNVHLLYDDESFKRAHLASFSDAGNSFTIKLSKNWDDMNELGYIILHEYLHMYLKAVKYGGGIGNDVTGFLNIAKYCRWLKIEHIMISNMLCVSNVLEDSIMPVICLQNSIDGYIENVSLPRQEYRMSMIKSGEIKLTGSYTSYLSTYPVHTASLIHIFNKYDIDEILKIFPYGKEYLIDLKKKIFEQYDRMIAFTSNIETPEFKEGRDKYNSAISEITDLFMSGKFPDERQIVNLLFDVYNQNTTLLLPSKPLLIQEYVDFYKANARLLDKYESLLSPISIEKVTKLLQNIRIVTLTGELIDNNQVIHQPQIGDIVEYNFKYQRERMSNKRRYKVVRFGYKNGKKWNKENMNVIISEIDTHNRIKDSKDKISVWAGHLRLAPQLL